jgi:hypothetical protein
MKMAARLIGVVVLGLVMASAVSVIGLSVFVYRGAEEQKQASAATRQFFHFVYERSQDTRPLEKPAGKTIK